MFMWKCGSCGTKNEGPFCGNCGAKRRFSLRAGLKKMRITAWVSSLAAKIKEKARANRDLLVFFVYYALTIFVLNSVNDFWWWIASNIQARQVLLEDFFQQWTRTYIIFYLAVPLIAEFAVLKWDKVKRGFLKDLGARLWALLTALVLFYLVYCEMIMRALDYYNFRHYPDRNTEDFLALTVFLVLSQPILVLLSFGLTTFLGNRFRRKS
jgi:hypothetical protein